MPPKTAPAKRAPKKLLVANEGQIVEMIHEVLEGEVSKADVRRVIRAFKDSIVSTVADGYKVSIPGLFRIEPQLKPGRKKGTVVRNPFDQTEKKLRADEPDKFVVKMGKSSAIAKALPSIKSAAGQKLAAKLPKPKR